MKEISFAWTTPALVTGHKTVTRREWQDDYAHRFHAGDPVTALDRERRYKGQPVGLLRLTAEPELQQTDDAPKTDYVAEGFLYLDWLNEKVDGLTPQALWRAWSKTPRFLWVVRFELVRLSPYGEELRGRYP